MLQNFGGNNKTIFLTNFNMTPELPEDLGEEPGVTDVADACREV